MGEKLQTPFDKLGFSWKYSFTQCHILDHSGNFKPSLIHLQGQTVMDCWTPKMKMLWSVTIYQLA